MLWLGWILGALLLLALACLLYAHLRLRRAHGRESAERKHGEQRSAERELLLQTLLDSSPLAVVFYADAGRIVFANQSAQRLFFEDQPAEGKNFLRLVESGPLAFRPALLGASDEIAGFDIDGQRETYHFARRTFPYAGELHTLLVVRQLTREVARHEIEVLKRVVRLLSHEVNNSLGPITTIALDAHVWDATPDASDATGCAGNAALPQVKANGEKHLITIEIGADVRELYTMPTSGRSQLEALQISHFTTAGELEGQYSFVEASDPTARPELSFDWHAPEAKEVASDGERVGFVFVVRDMRGGLAVTERALCAVR